MADSVLRQRPKGEIEITDEPMDTQDQLALIEQLERDAVRSARLFKSIFMGISLAFAFIKYYAAYLQIAEPWSFPVHQSVRATFDEASTTSVLELLSAVAFTLNAFFIWPSHIDPRVFTCSSKRLSFWISVALSGLLLAVWTPRLDLSHQSALVVYFAAGNFFYGLLTCSWNGSAEEANELRKYVYNFKSL